MCGDDLPSDLVQGPFIHARGRVYGTETWVRGDISDAEWPDDYGEEETTDYRLQVTEERDNRLQATGDRGERQQTTDYR